MDTRITVMAGKDGSRKETYFDLKNFHNMTREEFVSKIRAGYYPDYAVITKHGVDIPVNMMTSNEL